MNKNRIWILVAICIGVAVQAVATPRSEQAARRIAEMFLKNQTDKSLKRSATNPLTLATTSAKLSAGKKRSAGIPAWYVFNQGSEAFVIVAGDDRMPDILGYSTQGAFATEDMPDNLRAWLNAYTAQAEAMTAENATIPVKAQPATNVFPESVTPLLGDINYNQDEPYNKSCPTLGGERCVTGCGATAMATVMRYWGYPERGTGFCSYQTATNGIPCSLDFNAITFDWEHILPAYANVNYTDEEADAVATLMYACGVAGEADYGISSEGTSMGTTNPLRGMEDYFGYNPYARMLSRQQYDTQEWMTAIKEELSAERPIIYSGQSRKGGHLFLLDGYDHNGMVHVNWGWNGVNNGYYEIETLNPYEDEGAGYAFDQYMMVGIAPASIYAVPKSAFLIKDLLLAESLGGNIMVSIGGIYNYGHMTSGDLALIAEKDGLQTVMTKLSPFEKFQIGYGYINFRFFSDGANRLPPGTYRVYAASRLPGEDSWTKARSERETDEYTLTVYENGSYELQEGQATAITSVNQYNAAEIPVYCSIPGEAAIRFRYAKDVTRVEIYNLSGQLVRTAEATRSTGNTWTVPNTGMHGLFILQIHSSDGTTAILKFSK